MTDQYRIEIVYPEATTEIIIHSDDTVEHIQGPLQGQSIKALSLIRGIENSIITWMKTVNATKVEVTKEAET